MSITTVAELRAALKGIPGSTSIVGLDKGSDTRPYALYHLTRVEVGSVNNVKTVLLEEVPK